MPTEDDDHLFDIIEDKSTAPQHTPLPAVPKAPPASPAAQPPIKILPLTAMAKELERGGRKRFPGQEQWQAHRLKRIYNLGFFIPRRNEDVVDAVAIGIALVFPLLLSMVYAVMAAQEGLGRFLGVTFGWLLGFAILSGIVGPITSLGIKLADRLTGATPRTSAYWRVMALLGLMTGCYMIGHAPASSADDGTTGWMTLGLVAILVLPFLFVYLFRAQAMQVFSRAGLAACFLLLSLVPAIIVMLIAGHILGPFSTDFKPPRNLVMSLFYSPEPEPKSDQSAQMMIPSNPSRDIHPPPSELFPNVPKLTAPPISHVGSNPTIPKIATPAIEPATISKPEIMAIPRNAAELTDEMVVTAMTRAATRLLAGLNQDESQLQAAQKPDDKLQGEIALATYALLVTGRSTDDVRLQCSSDDMLPHIKTMLNMRSDALYTMALQASAIAQLPRRLEYRAPLKQITDRLVAGLGPFAGYTYQILPHQRAWDPSNRVWDNSNTQYGMLGAWAAADTGVDIPIEYWRLAEQHWRRSQYPSGGWPYSGVYYRDSKGKPIPRIDPAAPNDDTMTMSVAGVASLLAIMERIGGPLRLEPQPDPMLDAGLNHVVQDYLAHPATVADNLYYAYGLERVGLASGYKFFGKTNWYRDGATRLLTNQEVDGGWTYISNKIVGTAYALLFLARGRNAVVFNKLQYDGPWNARPNDCAHLANWLSKRTEKNINWQIVSFESEPEEWLDAPVLLITGHKDPNFSLEQLAKLQRFIRAGGTILSSADGGSDEFTSAIRTKYAPAVVNSLYAMRTLPANHPIYTVEVKIDAKGSPLMGLSNGVRELWVHSPLDLAGTWQLKMISRDAYWLLTENLFLYATGKASLRTKLQPLTVPQPAVPPDRTAHLTRLNYGGAWDPEPGAWERMTRLAPLQFNSNLRIDIRTIKELNPAVTQGVHMTGCAAFKIAKDDAILLKSFIDAHGIILADAAGGSPEFTRCFHQLILGLYPNATVTPLPDDHPLFTGIMPGGIKIERLEYRKCVYLGNKPALLEFKVDGRRIAILSEGDITSGLLGTNTWGIQGYTPKTAQQLAWNMVVLAANH